MNTEVPVDEPFAKVFKSGPNSTSLRTMFNTNDDANIWVKCYQGVLNFSDKEILQKGDERSDKHIQFAQKLIKGTVSSNQWIVFNTSARQVL